MNFFQKSVLVNRIFDNLAKNYNISCCRSQESGARGQESGVGVGERQEVFSHKEQEKQEVSGV